jgi:hypothetical protein
MRSILFVITLLFCLSSTAQKLSKANFTSLRRTEDTMKQYSRKMIADENASRRFIADSVFIRMLVRSLKTPYSFEYPFDSLQTVSRIYAPDSTFRIFSWQFSRDDNYFRQRGAIQVRTNDGSLQLYPLLDMSEFTSNPDDSVRTPSNWIGAIYYGIVLKTFNNKKYYTLFGFDDNNMRSTKKWIEVLTFDAAGRPVFGGPYFTVKDSNNVVRTPSRFCLEFKKNGNARVNYDPEMDMIVYDHLTSEDNHPERKYTLIPDGDYEGFKWADGRWVHVDKIFDFKLEDGQAPVPAPIKNAEGKSDEEKLYQQSEKNMQKRQR